MRIRGNRVLTALVLAVALLGALMMLDLWYRLPASTRGKVEPPAAHGETRTGRRQVDVSDSEKAVDEPDEPDSGGAAEDGPKDAPEPEPAMSEEEPEPAKTEEEMKADKEEALVEAFDGLTDEWQDPVDSDVPMAEVDKFREQFSKVPDSRKEECLQRALNLLPDENVMLLAGILMDKEQPREYLELVFNDVLNRDESVKKPLLELIYKDKEHPCWETTAWIFDATGTKTGK